jgi:hypothetical protein
MGAYRVPIFVRNNGRSCRLLPERFTLTVGASDGAGRRSSDGSSDGASDRVQSVRLSTVDRGSRTPVLAAGGVLPLTAMLDERCAYLRGAPDDAAPILITVTGHQTQLVRAPLVRTGPQCTRPLLGVVTGFRNPIESSQLPRWLSTAFSTARPSRDVTLTAEEVAAARSAARDLVASEDAKVTTAFAIAAFGVVAQPNTRHWCTSGRLLRITLIGSFPRVVTASGPAASKAPGSPAPGDVHAMLLTADAATGAVCEIGARTRHINPDSGSTVLDLS